MGVSTGLDGRKLLLLLLVIIGQMAYLTADEIRYAGEVANLPVGANIAAMGNTGVSLPLKATSSYWNPAAASMLSDTEISVEYANLFLGLAHHGVVAFHLPIQNSMAVSAIWIPYYSGLITAWDSLSGTYLERLHNPDLRSDGSADGYFYNANNILVLSLARLFSISLPRAVGAALPRTADIGAGVSFRGLWQTTHIDEKVRLGMNATLDLGLVARVGLDYDFGNREVSRHLTLGLSWRNVVPSHVVWTHSDDGSGQREYREPVHTVQMYGLSYTDLTGLAGADWTVSASIHREYETSYHMGLEGEFWDAVSFRVGVCDRVPTLGAGIRYRNYYLDYAFRFDRLDVSAVRVNLGLKL